MIDEGIVEGKYIETVDYIYKHIRSSQDLLYQNLNKHVLCEKKHPKLNQSFRSFATAKTHNFHSINDTTLDKLKLRPIIE